MSNCDASPRDQCAASVSWREVHCGSPHLLGRCRPSGFQLAWCGGKALSPAVMFKENADQHGDAPQHLTAIERGDPQAAEAWLPLGYQELRRLAAYKMAHEAPGQTLQPTPLPMKSRPCGASPDKHRWFCRPSSRPCGKWARVPGQPSLISVSWPETTTSRCDAKSPEQSSRTRRSRRKIQEL